ncbi:zinc-binding dehydrogenase [Nocardia cyriacigeorgica]|uniref:Zinc-binding dehydrogenase n=1 Tax=Nocardia cyriacigeorgica TaxID=135487 RepID=A0A5R8NSG8_9NOCA|nr:zinc-binding dehydrogenase [Nocardia cyriacigeorgica]TLF77667.1 zinc-binding dehydrogenase [Nocardia cyriacigeorgica]
MSNTFRAAVVRAPSGPDSIEIVDVPVIEPGPGEVQVAVAAAPVNPTDLGVAGGFFHELGMVVALAPERGWTVTGLARAADERFVRGLGADFVTEAEPGWDAVVDTTSQQVWGLTPVRDGGVFVGVRPNLAPAPERGITVNVLLTQSDRTRLEQLLTLAESGRLPARVHAVLPLAQAADAHRATAEAGMSGRYVLQP